MSNLAARRPSPRIIGWGLAAGLLLAPLLAMQFTSAVNWGAEDFLAAALLLGGAGLALEATVRLVRGTVPRIVIGLAILFVFALIWAELAVGIF
jgi:hypothetical protein